MDMYFITQLEFHSFRWKVSNFEYRAHLFLCTAQENVAHHITISEVVEEETLLPPPSIGWMVNKRVASWLPTSLFTEAYPSQTSEMDDCPPLPSYTPPLPRPIWKKIQTVSVILQLLFIVLERPFHWDSHLGYSVYIFFGIRMTEGGSDRRVEYIPWNCTGDSYAEIQILQSCCTRGNVWRSSVCPCGNWGVSSRPWCPYKYRGCLWMGDCRLESDRGLGMFRLF